MPGEHSGYLYPSKSYEVLKFEDKHMKKPWAGLAPFASGVIRSKSAASTMLWWTAHCFPSVPPVSTAPPLPPGISIILKTK